MEQLRTIFEDGLRKEIDEKGKLTSVNAGEYILHIGDTVSQIPIVLSGILKVSRMEEDGRELLLYYIKPNESCAMTFTCCMQQYPSEIQAVAEEDSKLLLLPVRVMDEWLAKYPTWKAYIMKTIRSRFHELIQTIDQVAFHKLDDRLISFLKENSKNSGSSLINMSHEQIASNLATSREVISRLLKKLENEKRVLLFRNQIKIMKEL